MSYKVELVPHVHKWLRKLRDRSLKRRIDQELLGLTSTPRPSGCVLLTGYQNRWRVRVGDYRIIYTIEDDRLLVLVIEIGHRSDIYG
jgi:mRNA interferase RelE/StbE